MKTRLLISTLVAAFILSVSPPVQADGAAQPAAQSATGEPAKCQTAFRPGERLEMTPQCKYLERCCLGNTPNAPKCCEGAVKKCGGKEPS
jgi:hypothetical protein